MRFLYEFLDTYFLEWFARANRQFATAPAGVCAGLQHALPAGAAVALLEPRHASSPFLQAVAGAVSSHGLPDGVQRHLLGVTHQPPCLPAPGEPF